ncbi:hypothetical protein [Dactylosporangium sp. NPDC048998]|uniref:hypothetical protein n=1 Tax=Dactylosporangium sp. NPDC048998 TaxID=3363976 RepID=UPI0037178EBB
MATWARVVLLQDSPRPYERVQAYRILSPFNPQAYRPRLARALGDLVDGFSPAAPADACLALLTEAATALRAWAGALVEEGRPPLDLVLNGGRNRRAADREGPDWDLLAASLALAAAGRGDAALAVAEELVIAERGRRAGSRAAGSRLAIALDHQATLLERRARSHAAASLRREAAEAAAHGAAQRPRSNEIAALLLAGAAATATTGRTPSGKRAMIAPGAAPSRTPMPL